MFERLGEEVERFKQEAMAERDKAAYQCRDCEETFFSEQEQCPACDSDAIDRLEE